MPDDFGDLQPLQVHSTYVQRTLEAEAATRDRLDKRSESIVTSAGGLVTVLGVVAALIPDEDLQLPLASRISLLAAVALFMISVLITLFLNLVTVRFSTPTMEAEATTPSVSGEAAIRGFLSADMEKLHGMRVANEFTFRILGMASVAQMLAVVALTVGVFIVLLAR